MPGPAHGAPPSTLRGRGFPARSGRTEPEPGVTAGASWLGGWVSGWMVDGWMSGWINE